MTAACVQLINALAVHANIFLFLPVTIWMLVPMIIAHQQQGVYIVPLIVMTPILARMIVVTLRLDALIPLKIAAIITNVRLMTAIHRVVFTPIWIATTLMLVRLILATLQQAADTLY